MKNSMVSETIGFQDAIPLLGDDRDTPYLVVVGDGFTLRTWLMNTFSRKNLNNEECIFNYRLLSPRHMIANSFGVVSIQFWCLLTIMAKYLDNVTSIVLACVTLHNIV